MSETMQITGVTSEQDMGVILTANPQKNSSRRQNDASLCAHTHASK